MDNSKTTVAFIKDRYENPPATISFKSIPIFGEYIGGTGEEEAILVISSTGASKTRLTVRLYILDVIDYIRKNPEYDVEVIFFELELSSNDIYILIMCALLHEKTGKNYSSQYLMNKEKSNPLTETTIREIDEIKDELDFIDTKLKIVDNLYTPDEIYNYLKKDIFDKSGKFVNGKYVKNNPKKNVIVVVDTINALNANKGKTEYESIKMWTEFYTKKILKKKFKAAIINVQQTDKASTTAQYTGRGQVIEDKFSPKIESLSKVKTTPDDHTLVISIYNPFIYEVEEYMGYNITILRDNFRYLKILKSTYSGSSRGKAIFIDNANMQVQELPKAKDRSQLLAFIKSKNLLSNNNETQEDGEE
jgi:hypothetical protein